MHAHHYLITDVLKGELRFGGIVVGDGDGMDQIDGQEGFTEAEVAARSTPASTWWSSPTTTDASSRCCARPSNLDGYRWTRVDEANRRILTKKFELGLFERPLADRTLTATVGSRLHRDLAREAVRQVAGAAEERRAACCRWPADGGKLFVAGRAADDLGARPGAMVGVGRGGAPGTTILAGIRAAVGAAGAVTYHRDGVGVDPRTGRRSRWSVRPPRPRARPTGPATLAPDPRDLAAVDRIRAAGVPVVVVLVSGRPLDVAAQLGRLGRAARGLAARHRGRRASPTCSSATTTRPAGCR